MLSASLQTLWPSHEKQVSISKVFHWLLNFNIFLPTLIGMESKNTERAYLQKSQNQFMLMCLIVG